MLNMKNLDLANNWAEEEVHTWFLDVICGIVAKIAYELTCPKCPRKLDVVMSKFIEKMIPRADDCILDEYLFRATAKGLTNIIHKELMSIKEFREWNLTTLEYEHGVDPDDDRNNEWWKKSEKDFIDLTAFKQNIYCALRQIVIDKHFHFFEEYEDDLNVMEE